MRSIHPSLPVLLALPLAAAGLLAASSAAGEEIGPSQPRSGLEVSVQGIPTVSAGQPARFRGRAFEVLGLAELRSLPGAEVRARVGRGPWSRTTAGPRGSYVLEVPVPVGIGGRPDLELVVAVGAEQRQRRFELAVEPSVVVELRADRRLYEPGERVRLWVRARDRRSLVPVDGAAARLEGRPGRDVPSLAGTTGPSGVVAFEWELPESAASGQRQLRVCLEDRGGPCAETTASVGRRTVDRLLVELAVEPESAAPGEDVEVRITVRTPSGAPVRGAEVEVSIGEDRPVRAVTDRSGAAAVTVRAPTFLSSPTGSVAVIGAASHPAHGSRSVRGRLRLAVPTTLTLEAMAPHGGVVPEVAGQVLLSVLDVAGRPPPEGSPVTLRGAAVRGGSYRGATDRHGLVVVPVLLSRAGVSRHGGGDCAHVSSGRHATTVVADLEGDVPRRVSLCLPVLHEALVAPAFDSPVVAPGDGLDVTVLRRPAVAGRAVVVDLLASRGPGLEVVASAQAGPGVDAVRLVVPEDRAGLLQVRARPLLDGEDEEGVGAALAVLVRPRRPTFPTLQADRDAYQVRGRAQLTLTTAPGAPRSFVAVLARDLAAHGGEVPFRLSFLTDAFDRAVLDPDAEGAEALILAALAAHATVDSAPEPVQPLTDALGNPTWPGPHLGVGRPIWREPVLPWDPFRVAAELRRRGVGPLMGELRAAVARALQHGTLDELVEGTGRDRVFRPDAVATVLAASDIDPPESLGGAPVTPAMLSAADPSFSFQSVARQEARAQLVRLAAALESAIDPDEGGPSPLGRHLPPERWLSTLVCAGAIPVSALRDPWGGTFALVRAPGRAALPVVPSDPRLELRSPGPDGRLGTADDVRDPFARAVPPGTPYANASGEDRLMAELATLPVARRTLAAVVLAYARRHPESEEERVGHAALAGSSEADDGDELLVALEARGGTGEGTIGLGSLGTIGRGGGGGSGSGYGRGAGAFRGTRASPGGGRGILSALVRERFPATLAFLPSVEVSPSGVTALEVPLADAVTSYLVEAVLWRVDGWTWSTSTEIRVDQALTVDAPLPPVVTVGDRVELPLRVANRSGGRLEVGLVATGGGALEGLAARSSMLTVEDGGAAQHIASFWVVTDGAGELVVEASGGTVRDAVRLRLEAVPDLREATVQLEVLGPGEAAAELFVPDGARPMPGSEVRVTAGDALFAGEQDRSTPWGAWSAAMAGGALAPVTAATLARDLVGGRVSARSRALAAGALWRAREVPDRDMASALAALTRAMDEAAESEQEGSRSSRAELLDPVLLLGLAPALSAPEARPELAEPLRSLVGLLRARVARQALLEAGAPWLWAFAAAALLVSSPAGEPDRQADELLRRAERHLVSVGDDLWLEGGPRRARDDLTASATAALALAEVRRGNAARAHRLLGTLVRRREELAASAGAGAAGGIERLLAATAVLLLGEGEVPTTVTVVVDGLETELSLDAGTALLAVPALGEPGRHRVAVRAGGGAVVELRARAVHGVPWATVSGRPGPFSIAVEVGPATLDGTSTAVVELASRVPRLVSRPVVEVVLPAGAELDAEGRRVLEEATGRAPVLAGRTLSLALRPMSPGASRRIEVPVRWTVAGRLRGFGVVARSLDRPADVSVLPSREVRVGR